MGIGGSGMSAVAMIAKKKGFEVTGCDLEAKTAYSSELIGSGIELSVGHDAKHLEGIDILAVTPAAFFLSKNHPELVEAKKREILMTWQELLGSKLMTGHKVVCVSGTHGKSTMTAMSGLLFEASSLDPSVVLGAKVPKWETNFRSGDGEYFICEADEFYDNFLNYAPDALILNNIEFDHPDYFKNEDEVVESFGKLLTRLKGKKTLIFNQDSAGIKKLFGSLPENFLSGLNLVGYTTSDKPLIPAENSFQALDINQGTVSTDFTVINDKIDFKHEFKTALAGKFNVGNCLGVVALGITTGVPVSAIAQTLEEFHGVGRRMELLGNANGIDIYDDYAHHPTAIKETLSGIRQKYPEGKIWAIVEPHTYSRTKALLSLYEGVFKNADEVIIAPIFKSRDSENYGISGESIVGVSSHKAIRFIDSFEKIIEVIVRESHPGDVVIVMGAGLSYKLAREILEALKK